MKLQQLLFAATLLACANTFAADFLPLETNNEWVYRNAATGEKFQVRVGLPVFTNDQVYYGLTGYAANRVLARVDEHGELVAFDEEANREVLLTSFAPFEGGHWQANFRPCDQEGQTLEKRTVYDGPAGPVRDVLQIKYRTLSCADTGVESEQFAENIGMLRRVVQTIAGPRTFELAYARVGRLFIDALPNGRFTLTTDQFKNSAFFRATLRLQTNGTSLSLPLQFPSAQEFEVELRDTDGNVVWRWSDGQAFLQSSHSRDVNGEWSTTVMIPRPPSTGEPKVTVYTVQAWMTTSGQAPSFSAAVPIAITTGVE